MSIKCPITQKVLRNSIRYPDIFISRCGQVYHKVASNKFVILCKTKKYRYLQISNGTESRQNLIYVHSIVGHAWVFNPLPEVFRIIDHIDRDCQNNDATNLRWITQQLNCFNKKVKGWEKIVKKNGAVFYRSVVRIDKKPHVTYCRSKEDAIESTKTRQREFFTSIYQRHLDDSTRLGFVNERPAHTFLWTDEKVETPEGFTSGDTGFCRYTEGRHAQLMF